MMPSYLQLEQIERRLRMDLDEIDDETHALVKGIFDHVIDVMMCDPNIAKNFSRRDLTVLVADAHFLCVDELVRHGWR
jgi:hypothetical protein